MQRASMVSHLAKTECVKAHPPLGDTICDLRQFLQQLPQPQAPHCSNHDRNGREMMGVGTNSLFVQDHTHEVSKNCFHNRKIGANALWDAAMETGKMATAVLVESTKTSAFSHATAQLSRWVNFNPVAMHSDTWPCESVHWDLLFGHSFAGCLGLFHFPQRIIKTIRKRHINYF